MERTRLREADGQEQESVPMIVKTRIIRVLTVMPVIRFLHGEGLNRIPEPGSINVYSLMRVRALDDVSAHLEGQIKNTFRSRG